MDAVLDDDAAAREIAIHFGAGEKHDATFGLNAAVHLPLDVGVAHVHVDADGAVGTHLEAIAIEKVAVELTLHPERALYHQRPAKRRAHADHRVGQGLLDRRLVFLSEKLHGVPPGGCRVPSGAGCYELEDPEGLE